MTKSIKKDIVKKMVANPKKRTTSDGYMPRKLEVKHEEGGKLYKMRNPLAGSKDEVKITGKGGFAKNFKKEKK